MSGGDRRVWYTEGVTGRSVSWLAQPETCFGELVVNYGEETVDVILFQYLFSYTLVI